MEKNQLYEYDVDFDCPDFQIQDACDITHFRIETNSGDAIRLSYAALIVNGFEFRVDDDGKTTFQVTSQNPGHERAGAVISKDYALKCPDGENGGENECSGNSDCASGGKCPIFGLIFRKSSFP